ncbi:ABC transporter substrate-binding protein [Shouchella rhizosphaerae]|uniref:ABC transporter substrate-binding protein n=1 Tax=Shouchella rhizosphaerae TaxID=866786 RepID=UPI003F7D8B53
MIKQRHRIIPFKGFILVVLTFMLLSACGSAADDGKATDEQQKNAGDDEVRVIEHAMGEETLTGTPQRIVVLTNEGTEALLALGVTPVGAVKSWLGDPWYDHIAEQMEEVEVVGDEMQPNIEAIAALEPDLIIGTKVRQEEVYEQLREIAPTIMSETLSGDWQENFQLYADAINQHDAGVKLLADFQQRIEEAKSELGDKTSTEVSIVRFLPTGARIYFRDSFSGVMLEQLGFARPETQDKEGLAEEITKERIPEMDGDIMFYFIWEEDLEARTGAKNAKEWQEEPLWKNLEVVKSNRAYEVDEAIWNTSGGILSANLMLDELLSYFSDDQEK